jgi:hypothetical protein
MLPELISTVEEEMKIHDDPRSLNNANIVVDGADSPHEEYQRRIEQAELLLLPHLFLHFDINETILVGDVAGNDTVEECLNKIIAKVAFVSTKTSSAKNHGIHCDTDEQQAIDDCDEPENDDERAVPNFSNFEPKRWWDGSDLDLDYSYQPRQTNVATTAQTNSTTGTNNNNCDDHLCTLLLDNTTTKPPAPSSPPAPLYTGWTIPNNTCSYYKTKYKRHAKEFTLYHPQYRPMYEVLQSKLLSDCSDEVEEKGTTTGSVGGGGDDDDNDNMFQHFIPAFFHTLMYYFPSTTTATTTTATATFTDSSTTINIGSNKIIHSNDNISNAIDYDNSIRLPRPPKTTLVLRTFGTDLPRVIRAISEFAKGNHPHFPYYSNQHLSFEDDDDLLFCGGWKKNRSNDEKDGDKTVELVYELQPMMTSSSCPRQHVCYSGDDEILNYLQSKSIVGIQDNYPFWDENDCAPWAGKPVWARTSGNQYDRRQQYKHHHILLDDNIHNDPNDGAGAVRISSALNGVDNHDDTSPTTAPTPTTSQYTSLHGNEALEMHGKHLIRVPTVRPIIEPDWFIRQIEDARWRIFVEERRLNENEERSSKDDKVK